MVDRDATTDEIRRAISEVIAEHGIIFQMLDEYDKTRKING
jgi:hypothetical protein